MRYSLEVAPSCCLKSRRNRLSFVENSLFRDVGKLQNCGINNQFEHLIHKIAIQLKTRNHKFRIHIKESTCPRTVSNSFPDLLIYVVRSLLCYICLTLLTPFLEKKCHHPNTAASAIGSLFASTSVQSHNCTRISTALFAKRSGIMVCRDAL
jgi:hypothetical protein